MIMFSENKAKVNMAFHITGCLKDRGNKGNMIKTLSKGGIDDYTPVKANRNAIVRLFLP